MTYKTYLQDSTPQSRPARSDQVKNHAGGYSFQVDPLKRLLRFLVLGTAGGTYYQAEREVTFDNIQSIIGLFEDPDLGHKAIDLIVEVSEAGRAPKNDPALAALALATVSRHKEIRNHAYSMINRVARIPTHLNHLVAYREAFGGGWGRTFKASVQSWYNGKDPERLSYLMAKYQSRDGWCHKDLLRLAHPVPVSERHNQLYRWALGEKGVETFGLVKGLNEMHQLIAEAMLAGTRAEIASFYAIDAQPALSREQVIERAVNLIDHYQMPFEVVPTELLKAPEIWAHLLPNLGYTSLIRSLARMAQAGYLVPSNPLAVMKVVERINTHKGMKKSKIHPIQLLSALRVYSAGHGARSSGRWSVCKQVCDTLEVAFYEGFNYVEPTEKRYYIGVDCSGSMGSGEIAGVPGLTPREAAAVMAMVLVKREPFCTVRGFTAGAGGWHSAERSGLQALPISKDMKLMDVVHAMERVDWGGTDCSLPIRDAIRSNTQIDCFITLTDSETWAGEIHPFQALEQYRRKSGIDAKNVVIAFTATDFSVADPNDPNSLDVAGFDSAVPLIIGDFARGNL